MASGTPYKIFDPVLRQTKSAARNKKGLGYQTRGLCFFRER